jgi:hypothetical protein
LQVISFDGSTTIEEFLSTLNQEIGCRDSAHSGFTLFSDDPIEKDLEHFIELQAKVRFHDFIFKVDANDININQVLLPLHFIAKISFIDSINI